MQSGNARQVSARPFLEDDPTFISLSGFRSPANLALMRFVGTFQIAKVKPF